MVTLVFPTFYTSSFSLNVFALPRTLMALYAVAEVHSTLEVSDLDYYLLASLLYLPIQSLHNILFPAAVISLGSFQVTSQTLSFTLDSHLAHVFFHIHLNSPEPLCCLTIGLQMQFN